MDPENWKTLRVNESRLHEDFERLSQIGATPAGGVNRPTFSAAHLEARAWFRSKIEQAGLELQVDGAGNHSARLRSGPPGAPALLLGSHLDSVHMGGRFDGALGVLAALEALRVVSEAGLHLKVDLEAIDFTDEEGSLCSFLGSQAFAGHLRPEDVDAPRGGRQALEDGLQRAGLSRDTVLATRRPPGNLAGYLELHIEQGKRLEQSGANIGIVSAIPGIGLYRLYFLRRADHAGAVPFDERHDAALGAGAFLLAYRQVVQQDFPGCFANVGRLELEPGMFNIVPERAEAALEYRALDETQFSQLEEALLACAREQAQRYDLGFEAEFIGKHLAAPMTPAIQSEFAAAASALGLTTQVMPSRAGHDGQSLANLCPVGMIFVPSVGGSSHSAAEFTRWEDCINGANVLLQAALRLAV